MDACVATDVRLFDHLVSTRCLTRERSRFDGKSRLDILTNYDQQDNPASNWRTNSQAGVDVAWVSTRVVGWWFQISGLLARAKIKVISLRLK